MAKKKINLFAVIPVLAGLILSAGVLTVFSACGRKEDGTWMHCHSAQNETAVCGIILAVLFVLALSAGNRTVRIILHGAAIAAGIVTFLIPGILAPMCMMHTMRCYMLMQPFVRLMAVIEIAFAAVGLVRAARHTRDVG